MATALHLPDDLFEALACRAAQIAADKQRERRYAEIEGVADYLGVSVRRARDFRERGMPARRIGRRLHFDLRAVDAWLEQQPW
jgi:excisionase family DNA binding protein